MGVLDEARKITDRAMGRVARMIRRGIVKAATAGLQLQVEGYDGERFDGVELFAPVGFSSRPAAASEILIVLVDGNPEQPIAIAGSNRTSRPSDLAVGDSEIYATAVGARPSVRTRADGDVDLDSPSGGAFVNVGAVKGDGALESILLGDAFITRMGTMNTTVTALGVAAGPDAAIINGLKAALIAFSASASALAAAKGKVK